MLPNYYEATLAQQLLSQTTVSEVYVSNLQTADGQTISIANFAQEGGTGYIIVDPQNSALVEYISFTGIDTVGVGFTGPTRGLSMIGGSPITANMRYHGVGAPVIIGWSGQDTLNFMDLYTAQAVAGQKTFTVSPIVPTPLSSQTTYAANVAFVLSVALNGAVYASPTATGITRISYSPLTSLGTCTISIATPAVITFASHGLTAGDVVEFTTTGALPTGITANTAYYVIASGLTTNTFEISTTVGGTALATTGTQSGVQTLQKATPYALSLTDPILTSTYSGAALNGSSNKIVDSNSIGTTANKIVALDGSARLPAVDGSQLFNLPQNTLNPVAGNEIYAGDMAYYSAANTAKRIQVNGYGTVTNSITGYSLTGNQLYYVDGTHVMVVYTSQSGQFTSGALSAGYYAINSGETDMTATIAGATIGINNVTYFELAQINGGTSFILAYTNATTNIQVLNNSGSAFSTGTLSQIDAGVGGYVTVDMITATTGIVGWNRSSDGATCLNIFTLSGSTITPGATFVATLPGTTPVIRQIKVLSNTLAAMTYTSTVGGTITHNVIPVNFSGTTVSSVGTNQSLTTAGSGNVTSAGSAIRKLSSGRIVIVTSTGSGATYGAGTITLTTAGINASGISGTATISSLATNTEFCANSFGNYVPLIVNSSTGFSIMYATTNGSTVTENMLTYEVDSLTLAMTLQQAVQNISTTSTNIQYAFIRAAVLKTGKFIMYGPVTTSFRLLSLTLTATTTRVGVVTANTAEGSTCSITPRLQATANIYSGLTFNSTYYIGNNGQPSLQQSTVNQVSTAYGVALSSTQILLQ